MPGFKHKKHGRSNGCLIDQITSDTDCKAGGILIHHDQDDAFALFTINENTPATATGFNRMSFATDLNNASLSGQGI
jgi:hypothetical protein